MFFSRLKKQIGKNIKFWIESNTNLFWRKGQKFQKERSFEKADISQKFLEIENLRINEMKKFLENKKEVENLLEEEEKQFMLLIQDLDEFKNFENCPEDIKSQISQIQNQKDYKNIKKSFEKVQNKKLKDLSEYKIKQQSKSIKKLNPEVPIELSKIRKTISQIPKMLSKISSLKSILSEDKKNIHKLSVK